MFRSVAAVAVALMLAGCSAAPATPAAPTASTGSAVPTVASPSASPTDTPVPMPSLSMQVIAISLKDGRATPNGDRVTLKQGTILRLEITSDHDDEVHVHGYDIEIPVKAGVKVRKDITLEQVGRFEIESHEPAITIVQLVVS